MNWNIDDSVRRVDPTRMPTGERTTPVVVQYMYVYVAPRARKHTLSNRDSHS